MSFPAAEQQCGCCHLGESQIHHFCDQFPHREALAGSGWCMVAGPMRNTALRPGGTWRGAAEPSSWQRSSPAAAGLCAGLWAMDAEASYCQGNLAPRSRRALLILCGARPSAGEFLPAEPWQSTAAPPARCRAAPLTRRKFGEAGRFLATSQGSLGAARSHGGHGCTAAALRLRWGFCSPLLQGAGCGVRCSCTLFILFYFSIETR